MDDEASLEFPPIAWRYPGLVGLLKDRALSHTAGPTDSHVGAVTRPWCLSHEIFLS